MEGRWKVLFGRWKGDGIVIEARSDWCIAANWAMLTPMGDGLKLIWWAIIRLVRSRVSLEADILVARATSSMCCEENRRSQ